jgi:hypothetical protein
MPRKTRVVLATMFLQGIATAAFASSADAWTAFREDVRTACLKASEVLIDNGAILVDPFGSESYGLALISGEAKGADTTVSAICVYDKKTKRVELGGELPAEDDQ